ncbi:hypothetical protein B0O99DRAFT_589700 [Bisporella sp. PMI_857]|nr:hypothetical protein B0O99DRAFT_589700 [Bisporella sp. PMI_857]
MSSQEPVSPEKGPEVIGHPSHAHNLEIPDNHFQVFQKSLLEHEFEHEEAFFSASLSRLQRGIYQDDKRLHLSGSPNGANVTLVAVTFMFHPMHSLNHRFKRANISIQASASSGKQDRAKFDQPLRIIKFAPHVAYGRISTESLHWTFALGANLGVTQPFTANVTPSTSFDRTKVIGTMLKIQGSSRMARGVESSKLPVAKAPFVLHIIVRPTLSNRLEKLFCHDDISGTSAVLDAEMGQKFSYSPFNFATMQGQLQDLIELPGLATNIQDIAPEVAAPAAALSTNPSALGSIMSAIKHVSK